MSIRKNFSAGWVFEEISAHITLMEAGDIVVISPVVWHLMETTQNAGPMHELKRRATECGVELVIGTVGYGS